MKQTRRLIVKAIQILVLLIFTALTLGSCTRSKQVMGYFMVDEKSFGHEYTWMIDSPSGGIDRYTIVANELAGENTLFIAHFADMLKNDTADKVTQKNGAKVSTIERANGVVTSMTVEGTRYFANEVP